MQPGIWKEPEDVSRRLANMGLTVEDLQEPIGRAQLARDMCTPDHPPGFKGMAAWGEGNGALRGRLGKKKWTRYNKQNIPRAVNPDKTIAITMIAGDNQTGDPDAKVPQPKRPRKEASQQLVVNNVAPYLPGLEPEEDADATAKLWYLLWYRNGDRVSCELSQPTAVDGNGIIEDYLGRIILPEIDLSQGPRPDSTGDQDPDVDVPIQRRAG